MKFSPTRRRALAAAILVGTTALVGLIPSSLGATLNVSLANAPLSVGATASGSSILGSINCSAPGNCVAVGFNETTANHRVPLVDTQVAGAWSAATVPSPSDMKSTGWSALNSVSCSSIGNCVAVGYYLATSGYTKLLLDQEVAGVWTNHVAPLPGDAVSNSQNFFRGVSCITNGNCVAVGSYSATGTDQFLIDIETNGVWSVSTASIPGDANTGPARNLRSVACFSLGHCVAVGDYGNWPDHNVSIYGRSGVIETLSSGTWSTTYVPLPTHSNTLQDGGLNTVSCASSGNCVAGGFYRSSDASGPNIYSPLAIQRTSGTWSVATTLAPSDIVVGLNSAVSGSSCSTSGYCALVGAYAFSGGGFSTKSLVYSQNNSVWSLVATPNSAVTGSSLGSVSCASPGTCVAVGSQQSGGKVLFQIESGGTWSSLATMPPVSAAAASLNGVSCSLNICAGVGSWSPAAGAPRAMIASASDLSKPQAPTITKLTGLKGALSVTFTQPGATPGAPILRYEYSLNAGVKWILPAKVSKASPLVITGLARSTWFHVAIRALNSQGAGPMSKIRGGKTL